MGTEGKRDVTLGTSEGVMRSRSEHGRSLNAVRQSGIEALCEVMHDAYEKAAAGAGWETQLASRKPWGDVPEANKATMRAAVAALLDHLKNEGSLHGLVLDDGFLQHCSCGWSGASWEWGHMATPRSGAKP